MCSTPGSRSHLMLLCTLAALTMTACGGAQPQTGASAPAAPGNPAASSTPVASAPAAGSAAGGDYGTPAPSAPSQPAATQPAAPAQPSAPGQGLAPLLVTVTLSDYSFEPKEITAAKGQTVVLTLKNTGDRDHDLVLQGAYEGNRSKLVGQGTESQFEFVADHTGTFEFICSLRGHKDRGMVGTLIVR